MIRAVGFRQPRRLPEKRQVCLLTFEALTGDACLTASREVVGMGVILGHVEEPLYGRQFPAPPTLKPKSGSSVGSNAVRRARLLTVEEVLRMAPAEFAAAATNHSQPPNQTSLNLLVQGSSP